MNAINDAIDTIKEKESHLGDDIIGMHYKKVIKELVLAHPSAYDTHSLKFTRELTMVELCIVYFGEVKY